MNCKPGDLAMIVRGMPPHLSWANGQVVKVLHPIKAPSGEASWHLEAPVISPAGQRFSNCFDSCLRRIDDTPGNEDFVVKARKTLPRAKPVTGPVTINERGEVA